jgi:IMP dehydrogenase
MTYNTRGKIIGRGLTFDDVLLVPGYSEINSRGEISIETKLHSTLRLTVPVISANMDTITGEDMCRAMYKHGCLGILHRFASEAELIEIVEHLQKDGIVFGVSVGVNLDDEKLFNLYLSRGINIYCVDVAHAHHMKVRHRIRHIRNAKKDTVIIAGNVATLDGAQFLADNGANVIKVGIGGGAICSTRIMTGCGVPQLTAIMDCAKIKQKYPDVKIIADGGIRYPGDITKAIAAGADAVMIGNMLAGTQQTPGLMIKKGTLSRPLFFKRYRGSASMEAKVESGRNTRFVEGISIDVPYRGDVDLVIDEIVDGLKSGCSYVGAMNLDELREKGMFIEVSNSGYIEGTPHGAFNY